MIKETEHFILTAKPFNDAFGNTWAASPEHGLLIQVKKADGPAENLLYVLPNTQVKFMEDPGTYLQTVGNMLQDTITSWDLFVELVKLIDEADYRVGVAVVNKDFQSYLD